MTAFTLQVGEFVAFSFVVKGSNGLPDVAAVASAGAGDPTKIRVRINPSNSREAGVLGLAEAPGINAIITALGHSAAVLFAVPTPPDLTAVVPATPGTPTVEVPDWML